MKSNLIYFAKKLLVMIVTLIAVSFLVFLAFEIIPGDVAVSQLGTEATPERVAALRHELGLDRPFLVRYGDWILSYLKGDFGTSYSYHIPVSSMIAQKIPITLTMSLIAFVITIAISLPLGVEMAKRVGSKVDKCVYTANQVVMSVPEFFLGIIITYVFGLVLHWFKPGGYVSYNVSFGRFIGYLIFPSIAIALPKIAMTVKFLSTSIRSELHKDYVRTAYAKGCTRDGVFYGHVLKNSLVPVITFMGIIVAEIVAGSLIVEQVFSVPGIGTLLITAISNRDYPVVEAVVLLIAFFIIAINFVVDMIYQAVDPRVKL